MSELHATRETTPAAQGRRPRRIRAGCGTAMEWRHATLQCPLCHFKIGCCEGPTADCSPHDR